MDPGNLNQHREGLTTSHHDWSMIQVGKLIGHQTVIQVDANSTVEDACETLFKNGISSAPVYDSQNNTYTGMFDYSDMMWYVLLALRKMDVPPENQTFGMRELIKRTSQCQGVPVKLVSDLSGKDPFCTVISETRLGAVVNDFSTGIHRMAIMGPTGSVTGILSQSSVLRYLHDHVNDFPQLKPLMQSSIEHLGLVGGNILSVRGDAQVLEALMIMSKNNVSSLALLDDQGILQGNISMADVRHVTKNLNSSWLWLSCVKFISNIRMKRGVENGEDQYPVLDVNPKSTFGYTIAKLIATKVHRLWIVNDLGQVIGVVSLTDIFRVLSGLLE
ncbi:cell separation during budding [Entomortierella beljakovae]|nr:cell separation during budding [Entomortierella beljakovae]